VFERISGATNGYRNLVRRDDDMSILGGDGYGVGRGAFGLGLRTVILLAFFAFWKFLPDGTGRRDCYGIVVSGGVRRSFSPVWYLASRTLDSGSARDRRRFVDGLHSLDGRRLRSRGAVCRRRFAGSA